MEQRLNIPSVKAAMRDAGLNQANLAERLGVTRAAVSQWLKGESTPRPNKLLLLAKLLELSFQEIMQVQEEHPPQVAFRKYRNTKASDDDREQLRARGRLLRNLVQYLPFDVEVMPPRLKAPSLDYEYVQQAADRIRKAILVEPGAHIDLHHIVRYFRELQAVLIPVLWGHERGADRHANATHIYLPDSGTTWVYLNLDTHVLDFKFWMVHELGHCLAPGESEEREQFADAFAGALLFSHAQAEALYREIADKSLRNQLNAVKKAALDLNIAPFTVCKQLEAYAKYTRQNVVNFGPDVHKLAAVLNKSHKLMSESILGSSDEADAAVYLERCIQVFETPVFEALGQYLRSSEQPGAGFVAAVFDIPYLDARSIYDRLT